MLKFINAGLVLLVLSACGGEATSEKRVLVLGVDGLDPDMVKERVERGLMPNFARLIEKGSFADLGTSWPPQSPVAWSNFITGTNPGKHGLYDFIHPDRTTYGLLNSMSKTENPWMDFELFGIPVQMGGGQTSTRMFPTFWDVMADAGVPVAIHRIPANFPLEEESTAVVYPDMGTPDLAGAASGRASLWFERSDFATNRGWGNKSGGSYAMKAVDLNTLRLDAGGKGVATVSTVLEGPPDPEQPATSPVTFHLDLTGSTPILAAETDLGIGIAEAGDWSDWVPVSFAVGGMSSVSGWTRFYFLSAKPFAVYAAPVQIDPWAPAMDVSTPSDAAATLADAIGPYYTQGFPDAYKSYKVGLLTTPEFVNESDTVLVERMKMLDFALNEFDRTGGLLFFYTGSLDMRCHMLWHCSDKEHPHQEASGRYSQVPRELLEAADEYGMNARAGMEYSQQIDRIYAQVDDLLGYLEAQISERWPSTELIIMSDHGFAPMHRVMNVNDWLVQEGYMVLKETGSTGSIGAHHSGDGHIDWDPSIVDWSKTKAYTVGFNGIILNRVGREAKGIIKDSEVAPILAEMQSKLMKLKDGGRPVFTRVLPATEVFSGEQVFLAPDLQLGFNTGFGASDPAAEGKVTGEAILVDNDSRWSGSHLMDPELVKGTLATRTPHDFSTATPALEDITATLYSQFGVTPPEGLDGKPLF
ncbi:MAG: alkaline phosphatase family protein [Planctomycetota bacterium]|jgi:predicted AlkP superfamily phosphohydrolase/phosphomutase|nr:alkaline phosphatase family protein [Planctomycetota bacterium]|tara:strand:+ start:25629 stop:27725 length:2097 start_codon:yes stop_codon:yes gene_type:complete